MMIKSFIKSLLLPIVEEIIQEKLRVPETKAKLLKVTAKQNKDDVLMIVDRMMTYKYILNFDVVFVSEDDIDFKNSIECVNYADFYSLINKLDSDSLINGLGVDKNKIKGLKNAHLYCWFYPLLNSKDKQLVSLRLLGKYDTVYHLSEFDKIKVLPNEIAKKYPELLI